MPSKLRIDGKTATFVQDGTPSLVQYLIQMDSVCMDLLTEHEFMRMEQLLADLLRESDAEQEMDLLRLHSRLQHIFETQAGLHSSRNRLKVLQSRIEQ